MKLTQKQLELLNSIYVDYCQDEFTYWMEPLKTDNKRTLVSLAKHGLIEYDEDEYLFRMIEEGILLMRKRNNETDTAQAH